MAVYFIRSILVCVCVCGALFGVSSLRTGELTPNSAQTTGKKDTKKKEEGYKEKRKCSDRNKTARDTVGTTHL